MSILRSLLLISLTQASCVCLSFAAEVYERINKKGVIEESYEYKLVGENKIQHGLEVLRNPVSGNVLAESTYREGLLDGVVMTYTEGGNLTMSINYRNGNIHGAFVRWNEDGWISQILMKSKGVSDGPSILFNKNGGILEVVNYKKGIQHGLWCTYNDDGRIETCRQFIDGEEVSYASSGCVQLPTCPTKGTKK
jgi:antitoxin component YwqK of YwqJK toxin-antitoxin module